MILIVLVVHGAQMRLMRSRVFHKLHSFLLGFQGEAGVDHDSVQIHHITNVLQQDTINLISIVVDYQRRCSAIDKRYLHTFVALSMTILQE